MPNPNHKPFLDRLAALPHFDYGQEIRSLASRHEGAALVQAIIDDKILNKDDACRYWADTIHVAYVDPFASVITDEAIERLPTEIARKTQAIGLYVLNGVLTAAMADPTDVALVRRLSQIAQIPVSPVFALPREIDDAISIHYCTEKGLEESLNELERSSLFDKPEIAGEKLAALVENDALVQILDEIIYFAMRERASDIHIEAQETVCRIRFRVDGNLREILTYSRKLHRALISRIKILCNLNITEMRFPQDGRFTMPVGSQSANFRVSTIPSAYGEKAVIRILASTGKKAMLTLDKMMISQTILQPFKRLIQNPNGIIFVTGPTGSGKTTTLYAALHEINTPGVNISTIEDPIEIQLPGVNQSQVIRLDEALGRATREVSLDRLRARGRESPLDESAKIFRPNHRPRVRTRHRAGLVFAQGLVERPDLWRVGAGRPDVFLRDARGLGQLRVVRDFRRRHRRVERRKRPALARDPLVEIHAVRAELHDDFADDAPKHVAHFVRLLDARDDAARQRRLAAGREHRAERRRGGLAERLAKFLRLVVQLRRVDGLQPHVDRSIRDDGTRARHPAHRRGVEDFCGDFFFPVGLEPKRVRHARDGNFRSVRVGIPVRPKLREVERAVDGESAHEKTLARLRFRRRAGRRLGVRRELRQQTGLRNFAD